MTRNTWMISMTCALVLAAPAVVSANDGLSDYDEDLSAYGEPRPAGHGQHWQPQHEKTLTVVDAETVQVLRRVHVDDGLGDYTEDLSRHGTPKDVVLTLVASP